jgi:hypothetical protein
MLVYVLQDLQETGHIVRIIDWYCPEQNLNKANCLHWVESASEHFVVAEGGVYVEHELQVTGQ